MQLLDGHLKPHRAVQRLCVRRITEVAGGPNRSVSLLRLKWALDASRGLKSSFAGRNKLVGEMVGIFEIIHVFMGKTHKFESSPLHHFPLFPAVQIGSPRSAKGRISPLNYTFPLNFQLQGLFQLRDALTQRCRTFLDLGQCEARRDVLGAVPIERFD